MAYRFKLTEPFDQGFRRIGLQQIDRSIDELEALANPVAAIHGTRKSLKRLRALLRLARPGLVERIYLHENTCLRDVGRKLASARDRQVLIETLDRMATNASGKTKLAFVAARAVVVQVHGGGEPVIDPAAIAGALRMLGAARKRFADLPFTAKSYEVAFDGLRRSYAQAEKAFDLALESHDPVALHEWRKKVQHHWRHLMLLSAAWPEMFNARIETARRLATLLGEDHDIYQVRLAALEGGLLGGLPAAKRGLIQSAIETRHKALRDEALNIGRVLFAQRPREFREQTKMYWAAAQNNTVRAKAD